MLSKNNFNERVRQMDEKKERFSIRKLTVGAASVLVGMTIFGMSNGQSVKADTQDVDDAHQAESQDVKAEADKSQSAQDVDQTKQDLQVKDLQDKVQNTDTSDSVELAKTNETLRNTDPKTAAALVNAISESKAQKSKSVTPSNKYDETLNNSKTHQVEETIEVHLPDVDPMYTNSSKYVHIYKNMNKDDNGNWSSVTFDSVSLKDLSKADLPDYEGLHPLVLGSTIANNNDKYLNDYAYRVNQAMNNHLKQGFTATPKIEVTEPVNEVMFHVYYVKDLSSSTKTQVDIYLPNNNNDTNGENGGKADYWAYIDNQPMTGYETKDGKQVWRPVTVSSKDIAEILKGNNFVDNNSGRKGKSLPDLKDYIPVLTVTRVSYPHNYREASDKLFNSLNEYIQNHPDLKDFPGYSIDFPGQVIYSIHFNKKVQDTEYETVHVYGPENDRDDANSQKHDGQSDYYAYIDKQIINGIKDYEGNTTWDNGVNFGSHSLSDILKGNNFTKSSTGYRGFSLPEYKGYHAVITDAQVMGGPQEAASKLFAEVNGWIKAHPNATEIPAFASETPLSIAFNVHFVKDAEPEQPTQPTKPQTSTPDVQPTAPETPVNPEVPAQPTEAAQPTSAPVLPEKTPDENKTDDNDKQNETVRPHAAKAEKKAAGVAKATSVRAHATKLSAKKAEAKAELPQTGEEKSEAGILGLAIASLAGLLGIAADRKRN